MVIYMLRIVHFIPGLPMGGAETLVKDYCLGIDKTKFEIIVLCSIKYGYPYEKLLADAGIKCIYINDYSKKIPSKVQKIFIHLFRYIKVKRIITKIKPDIIHIHLGLCRIIKYCNPKCRLFYTVHNTPDFVWAKQQKEEQAVRWLIYKKNMKMICLSQQMKDEVNHRFNINNSLVVNNGINFMRFQEYVNKSEYRKFMGIPENAFVIGNIGRFRGEKNHEFLIELFKEIVKNRKDAFLLLIGDGELKESIRKKLDAYKFQNKYLILSNRTDVPQLLKCMDFFVITSKNEGLCIGLIEAQRAGIKCIAPINVVPKETKLSNLIIYRRLEDGVTTWTDAILNHKITAIEYNGIEEWDMKNVIQRLEIIYLSD